MLIITCVLGVILGAAAGMLWLWYAIPSKMKTHIDYKQRWEDAVKLLETTGQLSGTQVTEITGTERPPLAAGPRTQAVLRSMATWDRAALEIARAKQGLPPVDSLAGMASWDIAAVLKAQAAAERRKQ